MRTIARTALDERETRKARRRYDRIAPVYDLLNRAVEHLHYSGWRPLVWERVTSGRILEVGIGTGANLPYHPEGVRVVGVDLSGRMLARAAALRGERPRPDLVQMDAQAMGFRKESFDAAVGTFVFCSVPDALRGLAEVRRVLRPGGRLLLLEHVRSGSPVLGRLMDWMNPLVVRTMGVNIDRDTVGTVRRAGFEIEEDRPLDRRRIFRLIAAVRPQSDEAESRDLHPIRETT